MQPNPLRDRFNSGATALGGWLTMPSPIGAEVMAGLDLDYVCIDRQHGLIGYSDSLALLASLTARSVTPLIRVPWNTPEHIGKALDAGAMGVIIPMVNSASACRAAVETALYPPLGKRSYGPTRAAIVEGPGYFKESNITVIPMIETVEALADLDGILSVENVTAIYVGPADLAISMGFQPGSDELEFLQALDQIVARCNAHGVVPGIHATSATAGDRLDRGFRMVTITSDLSALRSRLTEDVTSVRNGLVGKTAADH